MRGRRWVLPLSCPGNTQCPAGAWSGDSSGSDSESGSTCALRLLSPGLSPGPGHSPRPGFSPGPGLSPGFNPDSPGLLSPRPPSRPKALHCHTPRHASTTTQPPPAPSPNMTGEALAGLAVITLYCLQAQGLGRGDRWAATRATKTTRSPCPGSPPARTRGTGTPASTAEYCSFHEIAEQRRHKPEWIDKSMIGDITVQ